MSVIKVKSSGDHSGCHAQRMIPHVRQNVHSPCTGVKSKQAAESYYLLLVIIFM